MAIPNVIEMIRQLIASPSVSSVNPQWDQSNEGVVTLLGQWLRSLDFRVEIDEIPQRPGHFNLVALKGEGTGGLVLAGHTDTVPYDEGRWHHAPFRLTEAEGRLYGLGTSDMKAFFALVIEAVRDLDAHNLKRPLAIVATADEESAMSGAQALQASERRLGRYAVIGEPTGLRPIRMHKGIMMEAIRLHGRSGHSSDPALGVSALEGMNRVMTDILRWRAELQERYRNPLFRIPVPTLNLGHIHGGDNPNRICADCELQIDLRPLPGMQIEELRGQMRHRLEALLADSGLRLEITSLFEGIPAVETPAGSRIVEVAERLTSIGAGAVAFGTEAPYFQRMGLETLILGPGSIDQAHQPDEYLSLGQIDPAVRLIRSLVSEFCIREDAAPD